MQFSNYDFIDSKSFAGKIILTSFPGLNSNGLFEEKILKNEDIFGRNIKLKKVPLDNDYPEFILRNKQKFLDWTI